MVTLNNIPVPDPMTPIKSAIIDNAPIHIPPNAAAIGISLLSSFLSPYSVNPLCYNYYSLSYLATSLTPYPDISIQVFEKSPHVPIIKII